MIIKNYKVKCPGGRIYPITDIPFIINNELYSYQDRKIIKWEMVGNNELKETEICKIEGGDEYPDIDILDIIYNYARKTVLLQTNYGWYYEFDGTTYQLVDFQIVLIGMKELRVISKRIEHGIYKIILAFIK